MIGVLLPSILTTSNTMRTFRYVFIPALITCCIFGILLWCANDNQDYQMTNNFTFQVFHIGPTGNMPNLRKSEEERDKMPYF